LTRGFRRPRTTAESLGKRRTQPTQRSANGRR
jgi:hypothetical protein